jgi:hypothetical protein
MARKKQNVDVTAPTEALDLSIIGVSGLKEYGGYLDEEFYRKLKGKRGQLLYREMADNSSTIGAIRYIIKALVRQVEFRVDPAQEGNAAAIEQASFVESCLSDMSITFEDTISEVLSFLDYGWSFFEIIYKLRKGATDDPTTRSRYEDGKVGWRKLALRSQDTLDHWEFDDDGGLRGLWQFDDRQGLLYIPIEKALLFRTETTKDNPEGRSIFRNAVVDYFFLKRICEIEALGIERDMTGMITMEVPIELLMKSASAEQKHVRETLEKMLSELKRDEREFALVPSEVDRNGQSTGYKLKLLSSGGSRQIDTNGVKLYYKQNILQSVVAQFLQLGMNSVGSFALASSQTDLFAVALINYIDTICAVLNRFGVARLMTLNGVPTELWPEVVHGDIETPPLAEIGNYISALAAAGQLPEDAGIKRKLLEFAKLPIPEEEVIAATPAPIEQPVQKKKRYVRSIPMKSMGSPPRDLK